MTGLLLCAVAFASSSVATYIGGLGHGLGATIAWGYFYGILRANIQDTFTHLVFDSAVLGFYLVAFLARPATAGQSQDAAVRWAMALIAWPFALMFLSKDPLMIELVGFRSAVLFIPFLLVGTRCEARDWRSLSLWLVVLNIAALGGGVTMYVYGIEPFYPRNLTTDLLYRSTIAESEMHRIPSFFVHSAGYAGAMVVSLPVLASQYLGSSEDLRHRVWMALGFLAALANILLSASRSPVVTVVVAVLCTAALTRGPRLLSGRTIGLLVLGGAVLFFATSQIDERMQRFRTMQDPSVLIDRFGSPLQRADVVLDIVWNYPLGNGLTGAFGISIPYFLQDQLPPGRVIVGTEDEYSRIAGTQGLPGILLYLAFFVWVAIPRPRTDYLSRFSYGLFLATLAATLTGAGAFYAVPSSALLFVLMGWTVREVAPEPAAGEISPEIAAGRPIVYGNSH